MPTRMAACSGRPMRLRAGRCHRRARADETAPTRRNDLRDDMNTLRTSLAVAALLACGLAVAQTSGTKPATLATFRAVGASLKRDVADLPALAANPLPEPDLSAATELPFILSASAEERPKDGICGSLGYNFWAINKVPWADDTGDPTAPLAEMKAGRTYLFNVENPTPQVHRNECAP